MEFGLLKEVISQLETYEEQGQDNDIESFVIWLNQKIFSSAPNEGHGGHDDLLVAFKLIHLNRDIKRRTKAVLAGRALGSVDEYSFLLHLDHSPSFRKMEIIEMHNLEAPTGIEVIKRLLRAALVEEFQDPEDGRAKRIRITPAGKAELDAVKPMMDEVWANFVAPLELNEKVQVSGVLDKLLRSGM